MKHVRVRITADGHEAEIHRCTTCGPTPRSSKRATALQWNFTGDALGILHYGVGDADDFEGAVERIPEVLDTISCEMVKTPSTST